MGGSIHIETGSVICQNCKIASCGGNIHVGKNSVIGDGAIITAQGDVIIGESVLFADRVSIIANEHI